MGEISVYRRPDVAMDRNRRYKVLLDGRPVAEVWPAETAKVRAEPGRHRVQIRIDIYRSNEVTVDLSNGEQVELVCLGRGVWRSLVAGLFRWHSYLILRTMSKEDIHS